MKWVGSDLCKQGVESRFARKKASRGLDASRGRKPLEGLRLGEEKGLASALLREEDLSRVRPLNQVNTFQFTKTMFHHEYHCYAMITKILPFVFGFAWRVKVSWSA